jgi:hypothetical protein
MLTITIELRIDFDTANKKIKEPIMRKKGEQVAKELLTLAELIADNRKPQISIQAGDFFATTEEIKLVEDEDT